jgi:trans-2,3-dihydro-3-hydroxyanthranilate isomerase
MSPALPFFLVDVFADRPLAGNPLAVVADADQLDEQVMRAIAREFNQSETTFVLATSRPDASWRLRSFTPAGAEVGGAGHNALGAWWWLASAGRLDLEQGTAEFTQEIAGRVLPVEVIARDGRPSLIAMRQEQPAFGPPIDGGGEVAAALGLAAGDLGAQLPPRVVSTGAPHLMVQARDRVAVDRAKPDGPRLGAALTAAEAEGCYLFSLDAVDPRSAAYARFFNPAMGIAEDPATGTAAGPLASHLVDHGVVEAGRVWIEQGHALGRPSRIEISVEGERVTIAGAAVIAAEGTLRI